MSGDTSEREVPGYTNVRVVAHLGSFVVHRAKRDGVEVALSIGASDALLREHRRIAGSVGSDARASSLEGALLVTRPWVDGIPLAEAKKRALLSACATLEPVARTLGALHRAGLADGALSPARVIVGIERAVLLDPELAAMGEVPIAPSHAAPELLEQREKGPRADVYSLALLYLELASGARAYGPIAETELLERAGDRSRRPTLGALGVAASSSVERVLARALSVDPELRFADATTFWDALQNAVVASPTEDPAIERPKIEDLGERAAPKPSRAEAIPIRVVVPVAIALAGALLGLEAILHKPALVVAKTTPPTLVSSPSAPPIESVVASAAPMAEKSAEIAIVPSALMLPVPAEDPAFFVDRTEVTVAAFRACVKAGACSETPKRGPGWSENDPIRREWLCNYHRKGRDDHPINCVSLPQATAYCAFVGKRLPTGPEWTRAARGDDARVYPWGDALPRCNTVVYARYGPDNYGCSKHPAVTEPIGRAANASPFGAEDMAGSLWEWTTETAHGLSVLRGGAWDSPERGVAIEARLEQSAGNADVTLGFRCVRDR